MKTNIILFLITILSYNIYAQNYTIDDFTSVINSRNQILGESKLRSLGFEYYKENKDLGLEKDREKAYIWAYNRNKNRANVWLYVFVVDDKIQKIIYDPTSKDAYVKFKNSLSRGGLRFDNTFKDEDVTFREYSNPNYFVTLGEKESYDDENQYAIIFQKEGFYDKENGPKIRYYENGVVKEEFTLKDDKVEDLLKVYNENGTVDYEAYFKNDKRHGPSVSYYYLEDTKELVIKYKGNYANDEREGLWEYLVVEDGLETDVAIFHNYKGGVKHGEFNERKGDSLIIGNYNNGELHGKYLVYLDVYRALIGTISTDTTAMIKLADGQYAFDKKNGHWWHKDFYSASQGDYLNDKMTGEWKYFFPEINIDMNQEHPASKKLFMIANYSNGNLNGISERYWYREKIIRPCSKEELELNPGENCYENKYHKIHEVAFYRRDKLHGLYELLDAENNIIQKGYYINGKRDGGWVINELVPEQDMSFYSKGQFIDDIKNGVWEEAISFGGTYIKQIGDYQNGKRNGKWESYDADDNLMEAYNYKDDELHGENISYAAGDIIKERRKFKNGKILSQEIYSRSDSKNPYLKNEVINESYSLIKYVRTNTLKNGYTTQEYSINKRDVDTSFNETVYFTGPVVYKEPWRDTPGIRDGKYFKYDMNDRPLISGSFYHNDKIGIWTNYYYRQNVKIERNLDDVTSMELYLNISGTPFTGTFTLKNDEDTLEENIKVKNGYRHGNTTFIDVNSGKLLNRIRYKNGEIR